MLGLVWFYSVVFHLICLDLIVFGCLLLFLSVSDCINMSDGENLGIHQRNMLFDFVIFGFILCYM